MKKNNHYFIDPNIIVPNFKLTEELFKKFVNDFIIKKKKQKWIYLNKSNRHIATNSSKLIGDIETSSFDKMKEIDNKTFNQDLNIKGVILDIYDGWQYNSLKSFLGEKDF